MMVIGASTIAGFMMAERLKERSRLLRIWLRLLNVLQTEIGYCTELLTLIFTKAARIIDDRKMAIALQKMAVAVQFGSDQDVAELWGGFLHEKQMEVLSPEDREALGEMGSYLGSTDRQDQLERIKVCRARLESNLELANLDITKRVRLYRYLGFAIGAVIVCLIS